MSLRNVLVSLQQWYIDTFCPQDMETIEYKGPDIIAAEVATCYPPETRDIVIIDIGAGTGLLAQKVCYY